jgi:hypothetical protein
MNRDEALAILIGARHHCFARGVLGSRSFDRALDEKPADDFRAAFRELNRLYVVLRDRPESTYIGPKMRGTKRNAISGPSAPSSTDKGRQEVRACVDRDASLPVNLERRRFG